MNKNSLICEGTHVHEALQYYPRLHLAAQKKGMIIVMGQEHLERFSKEELCNLISAMAKNWLALDGLWFQAIEQQFGADETNRCNKQVWSNYTRIEGKRIKEFLNLPEDSGLNGLAQALLLRFYANLNQDQLIRDNGRIIYRMNVCRIQEARKRKGLPSHPCKWVAEIEYGGFTAEIGKRIHCRCLSCYPDVTDKTCNCAWEFFIEGKSQQGSSATPV